MPRNGSGVYSKPAGTTAIPNTTIESAKYNSTIDDIAADLNLARPIVVGGTAGTTAVAGGDNLSTKGADVPSAATTDIGAATGRYVHITGTTTITSFGTKTAGVQRVLTFDGILTLTHNATSLILPGGANILTAAGDVAIFVSEGSGNWRCVSYERASGESVGVHAAAGHLYGMTLSNNATDSTNDIDIAAGSAASDGATPFLMTLASAITKRVDAAWAVGTGNGGLDTGSVADVTYHVWLIQRSDTGVVDALFSQSATSPTMPTNYDRKRRIGSFTRNSGANLQFTQNGDEFLWMVPVQDVSVSNPGTAAVNRSLTVPSGIVVRAIIAIRLDLASAASPSSLLVTALSQTDTAPGASLYQMRVLNTQTNSTALEMRTDTARRIRTRLSFSDANTNMTLTTFGWIDTRGRT